MKTTKISCFQGIVFVAICEKRIAFLFFFSFALQNTSHLWNFFISEVDKLAKSSAMQKKRSCRKHCVKSCFRIVFVSSTSFKSPFRTCLLYRAYKQRKMIFKVANHLSCQKDSKRLCLKHQLTISHNVLKISPSINAELGLYTNVLLKPLATNNYLFLWVNLWKIYTIDSLWLQNK